MRTWLVFAFILCAVAGRSQGNISNYKYVLVPHRYDFQKSDDQYGMNSTTKSLLEQKGFTVFYTNDNLPPALINRCGALVASVDQRKGFFSTNVTLTLKDCSGNIVFKTREGTSRDKEFYLAYDHALRDAFVSLNAEPYKYDSTAHPATAQVQTQPQPTQPQQSQTQQPVATSPANTPPPTAPGTTTPATTTPATPTSAPGATTLYAQPVPNGFQLIDTSPKKVLTLLKTSLPDYFIAQSAESSGLVFKKDGEWHFEYYNGDKLMSQKLDIKF
jgi:hypothetical protein